MRRNILSGVLSVVSGKILTLLVTLVTMPLLYRFLGPAQFGEYTTVMSIHALFMIFVSSGITNGVRKFVAEDRTSSDWEDNVVGFYFRMASLLAALGALGYLGAVRMGLVAWYFDPSFEPYFKLMVFMVVAAQFWAYARRTLMGFGLERYSEPLKVLYHVAFAAVAISLVYYGFGVIGALAGQIVGTAIAAVIGVGLVMRRVSLRSIFLPTSSGSLPRRQMLTYNTMAVALTVCQMSLYHVDIIMLQSLAGSTQVGNYKTALTLAEFLWFVPMTLQTVYVHSTSELWSQDRTDRIASLASRTTRYTLLLTTVMALGLASLAETVVPLYWGAKAAPAVTPLLFLLPGALGFAAVRPTIAIEEGHGTLRYSVVATGASAVLNLGLNLLLIPRYGMTGAAIATSVGYASMFLFHIWSARQLDFDPLADARLLRVGLTVVLAAGPILLLPQYLATNLSLSLPAFLPSGIVALVVVPPVGLAVFLTFAFLTGALELRECVDLLSAFPDPIGSTVERADARLSRLSMPDLIPNGGQFWLLLVGLLLFASGTGIAVMDIVTDGGAEMPGAGNATETPTEATTPVPEDTQSSSNTGTSTQRATDTPTTSGETEGGGVVTTTTETDEDGSLSTSTPTETATQTATETETDDGDGGFFGGGGSTDTETETETQTPTETATQTPTETETDDGDDGFLGGGGSTDTETETQTTTETATTTETQTTTETATTSTATETATTTTTSTATETATTTTTSTATENTTTSETTQTTESTSTNDGLLHPGILTIGFEPVSAAASVALSALLVGRAKPRDPR
ncbi:polysaccharide biosynthesis C-terminal domain-containing protein [Halomicroarcula sp. F13]|uniref:Polysaccharide biosynthesis C-terminal domain-containing protein n=1 Tax=Haloarcula rubra TaxID=2487747 RepID=A0AAW4PT74_9EURY|nr:polysaccharide biosynthesis C-terminal domain-containing protein [Halomicroarcula rubra]MBX0324319.1 polysaccharide biosynthesis C-terminal domain-containing protein [Halomicroarcula rubra]